MAKEIAEAAGAVLEHCRALARCTETPGAIERTFLTAAMADAHNYLHRVAEALQLETRLDAAGNFRLLRCSPAARAPCFVLGSHIDTVPNAGAYDGVLGVAIALELLALTAPAGLPFDLEVIAFSEEEGVRFATPFIGSRAAAGLLTDEYLEIRDRSGITLRQAIVALGLDPAALPSAVVRPDTLGYLEFHIEQGPVLESLNLPLAAVDAIAGQSRYTLHFSGKAAHAGTTPMHLRADALACAAEWISRVEQTARDTAGLVATVGAIEARPGAGNVIAADVSASLDIRHLNDAVRKEAVRLLLVEAEKIASRRGLRVTPKLLLEQRAVPLNANLTALAERAVASVTGRALRLVSGAGHDAMVLAAKIPAAMIFIRSPGGISHHPDESVLLEDIEAALRAGVTFLDELSAIS